ncbi:MAG TPA: hypothetical protein VK972_09025 [Wenzhouxiangella sp.]|nr:hypothetical protein [Wenzhouxiangella sp.]
MIRFATRLPFFRPLLFTVASLAPLIALAADNGPEHGILDHAIVAVGVLIVIGVLVFTIKYLVRPGEKSGTHIKRRILDQNWQEGDDER